MWKRVFERTRIHDCLREDLAVVKLSSKKCRKLKNPSEACVDPVMWSLYLTQGGKAQPSLILKMETFPDWVSC